MDGCLGDNATVERVVGVVGYDSELSELSIPNQPLICPGPSLIFTSLFHPYLTIDLEATSFRIGKSSRAAAKF